MAAHPWSAPPPVGRPAPFLPPPPPQRPTRIGPVVWVSASVLALLAATFLTGNPPQGPNHRAATLLGADGSRSLMVDQAGHRMMVAEWSRGLGMQVFESGPESYVMASTDLDELNHTNWARLSLVSTGEGGGVIDRSDTLFAVTPAGVETRVRASGDQFRTYRPAELVLPAAVAVGSTWQSSGTSVDGTGLAPGATRSYQLNASATRPADVRLAGQGCLDVTYHEVVGTSEDTTETLTWCPATGVVAASLQGAALLPAATSPDWAHADLATTSDTGWGDPRTWASTDVDFARKPPMFLTPRTEPGLLPGDRVVFANEAGRDLVAVDAAGTSPNAAWRAHPGGDITTMATFGSVTVAGTTARRLIAYGPDGQFLWNLALPDVSQVALVAVDDRTAAVACLDGTVLMFEIATGEVTGRFSSPNEIRVDPVAVDDRLYVVDQSGALSALGPDAVPAWQASTEQAQFLAADDRRIVIADGHDNDLSAYSARDGSWLWSASVYFPKRALALQGDRLLIRSNSSIIALDARTGATSWSAPGTPYEWLPGPAQTLVVEQGRLVVIDNEGRIVRTIADQLGDLETGSVWVSRGNGRFAVFRSNLAAVVRP